MHPSLCEWPSLAFYDGRLASHPKPQDRPTPAGLPWPNPQVPVHCQGGDTMQCSAVQCLACALHAGM
jgi:hypothetical protein